jgi:hypothetical protein
MKARDHRTQGNRILDADKVRSMLGIGKNTLYSWCTQGLIPHKRVGGKIDEITGELHGGRILFSENILLKWIENRYNDN